VQALTLAGAPFPIAERPFCSFVTDLEVTATPKGAIDVVWADDPNFEVKALRFARNLQPIGPPQTLLQTHGGLSAIRFSGSWAGRYELVLNVQDYADTPDDPAEAYRVQLDLEGEPVAPAVRLKPRRFVALAPASGGDSLLFRFEPPTFGPPNCQSRGLLAQRIDRNGAPLAAESRVNRRAPAWGGYYLTAEREPDDTFVAVYSTCQYFEGLVARRLTRTGAPVGKPFNLPLPGPIPGIVGSRLALAAHGADFAVAVMTYDTNTFLDFGYTYAVANSQVFGPTRITPPAGAVVDLAASPSGGYLLLFRSFSSDPPRQTLFAQELDAHGVPHGEPLAIVEEEGDFNVDAAVTSLPNGRWIVVRREQRGNIEACSERLVGVVLAGG